MEEINNRAEVYIDGGIRNGADVFKALALGARAVFLGRPVIWGLIHNVNIPILLWLFLHKALLVIFVWYIVMRGNLSQF